MVGAAEEISDGSPFVTHLEDGIWILGERVKSRRIKDGLANTYLIGEKAMDSLRYHTGDDLGDRARLLAILTRSVVLTLLYDLHLAPPA